MEDKDATIIQLKAQLYDNYTNTKGLTDMLDAVVKALELNKEKDITADDILDRISYLKSLEEGNKKPTSRKACGFFSYGPQKNIVH